MLVFLSISTYWMCPDPVKKLPDPDPDPAGFEKPDPDPAGQNHRIRPDPDPDPHHWILHQYLHFT